MTIKAQVLKRFSLIEELMDDWRTIEHLERTTGFSRAQIFRTLNQLQDEYQIEIDRRSIEGENASRYRIMDMGIINRERFILMQNKRKLSEQS